MSGPAFQLYAQDFLTGCIFLTNEEVGIYIRILTKQWTDGKIPKKRLGFLVGFDWVSFSDELKGKFIEDGEFIYNKRLENEREKHSNFHKKQAENGKKGGRPRKNPTAEKLNNDEVLQVSEKNQKKPNETQPKSQTKAKKNPSIYEDEIEVEKEDEIENENKGGSGEKIEIEILEYLNLIAEKNFQPTKQNLSFIKARLSEKFHPQVLKQVIELKSYEWKDDFKMKKYLRPETLFNSTKFQNYCQEVFDVQKNPQKFKEYVQHRNSAKKRVVTSDPLDSMPDR